MSQGIRAWFGLDPGPAKKGMKEAERAIKKGSKEINTSLKSVGTVARAAFTGWGVGVLGQDFLKAAMDMDSMKRSMGAAVGGMEKGRREINFLRVESQKLGLSFRDQIKDFKQLSAAAKGTALEGSGVRKVWRSLMDASTALQLSTAETSGVIWAFKDMLSKGTVQAEELKKQLGNRLPGAFRMAADAMMVSTKEMMKHMKQGKIMTDSFLPALAEKMTSTYGGAALEAAKSMRAELNRMKSSWFDLQVSIMMNSKATDFFTKIYKTANKVLIYFFENIDKTIENLTRFFKIIGTVVAIKTFTGALWLANKAISAYSASITVSTALTQSFGVALASIAKIAGAAFIGFQIGDYLQKEFQVARGAGVVMVDMIMSGIITLQAGFRYLSADISFAFSKIKESVMPFWILFSSSAKKALIEVQWNFFKFISTIETKSAELAKKIAKIANKYFNVKMPDDSFFATDTYSKKRAEELAIEFNGLDAIRNAELANIKASMTAAEWWEKRIQITKKYNKELEEHKKLILEMHKATKQAPTKKRRDFSKDMPLDLGQGFPATKEISARAKIFEDLRIHFEKLEEKSTDVAKNIGAAFTSAFKGVEDALVQLVVKGKIEWRSLAESMASDMVRLAYKQAVLGPLAGAMATGFANLGGMFGTSLSAGGSTGSVAPSAIPMTAGPAPIMMAKGGTINEHIVGFGQSSGRRYEMGESGKEHVLNQDQIKSLGSNKGVAVSVQPQINISTPPGTQATTQQSSDGMNVDVLISAIESKLASNGRRGGNLFDSIQQQFGLNRASGAFR